MRRFWMTTRGRYWLIALGAILALINAVPAFAANGVIWGT
jgi:hypothetical protein